MQNKKRRILNYPGARYASSQSQIVSLPGKKPKKQKKEWQKAKYEVFLKCPKSTEEHLWEELKQEGLLKCETVGDHEERTGQVETQKNSSLIVL